MERFKIYPDKGPATMVNKFLAEVSKNQEIITDSKLVTVNSSFQTYLENGFLEYFESRKKNRKGQNLKIRT